MTPTAMQSYIKSHGDTWGALVSIAYQCRPDQIDREAELLARAMSATKATVRRKFEAIHHKREQGWTEEAITKEGQGPTLSSLAASKKKEKQEVDVILRYRVPASLAAAWNELVADKLMPEANLTSSEDLFEFLYSVFVPLSKLQVQNLAGTRNPNDKAKRV